ncbi:MAG: stage 0 sporulation family protein [Clostridiales bacterium]|nr:stage 0 sporulation family protein [Clostridiales bacterium]
MPTVIGVRFRSAGKRHYVRPGPFSPLPGDTVIVPFAGVLSPAEVCEAAHEMPENLLPDPLPELARMATPEDLKQLESARERERRAFVVCRERIAAHKLDMKLVDVEFAPDNSKVTACFTSGGRVDFRALVKDLAGIFKMRIELKQIGVRDEAKKIGGVGSCGRGLCCSTFLYEFQPVSIRMAKEQSLSLNPTKISGVCGRLLCCLKYEQEQYEKSRKRMPKLGKEVITPQGRGVVTQLNALLETVQVRVGAGEGSEIKTFPASDVQRVNPPQPQRGEPAKPGKEPENAGAGLVADMDEEFLGTPVDPIVDASREMDE